MAKPIFIVRFPQNCSKATTVDGVERLSLMRDLVKDYHVIPVLSGSSDYIEFEVLNATNATDIEIEELKNKVLNQLTPNKDESTREI